MAENSKIEWTDHTINFWWGCTKVSPACANCYAEGQAARFFPGHWGPDASRRTRVDAARHEALRYEHQAAKLGRRFRVFTNSMSDFFEDRPDLTEARQEALDIIMSTPHLDWLILTKRPEKIQPLLAQAQRRAIGGDMGFAYTAPGTNALSEWLGWWLSGKPPANVWLGTTVEDQERAEERIPALVKVPAALHFLSCEPLLGPVDLESFSVQAIHPDNEGYGVPAIKGVDWVICGGESGPHARPMHPDWARGLRDQCADAGVPFLFKQWGGWGASAEHMATGEPRFRVFESFDHWVNKASSWMSKGDLLLDSRGMVMHCGYDIKHGKGPFTALRKVGKKAAGRFLDGMEHNGYPQLEKSSA